MRILPISRLMLAVLLAACGRGVAVKGDPPRATVTDTPVTAAPQDDSVAVVAHVGEVTVEDVWRRDGGYARLEEGRVKVNGRLVLADNEASGMRLEAYWPLDEARTLILLGVGFGGTACDRTFRVLEVTPDTTYVTDSFGTCEAMPDSMWFDRSGALRMRFPDWAPMRVLLQDENFVYGPPTTYVYRGRGRVDTASAARE
jgi:hypothetical protein